MIRISLFCFGIFLIVHLSACDSKTDNSQANTPQQAEQGPAEALDSSFAGLIEYAHEKNAWYKHHALSCDISLYFNEQPRLMAKMYMRTHAGRSKISLENGVSLHFDGQEAYISPQDAEYPDARARFDVLTWPYFLAAPYKLKDPGAKLVAMRDLPLKEQTFETAKMTFTQAVGDTPEDWYVLFRNPESKQLEAMAYIVTFGKTLEEANADPHLIRYENFQEVEGVPLATRWTFWEWKEESGLGKQIGEASLENFRFLEEEDNLFTIPDSSRVAELPRPEES